MELRHLTSFVVVAEELNFTRAAERLRIAQSPLSQQIRHLESHLGVRLFERSTRSVSLTNAGRTLFEHARQLLADAQRAAVDTQRAGDGEVGSVRVGFGGMQLLDLLPAIARSMKRERPGLDIDVQRIVPTDRTQFELLRNRAIDVSHLAYSSYQDKEFVFEEVAEYRLALVVSEDHPLADIGAAPLSAFRDDVFIGHPSNPPSALHSSMISACAQAGFYPTSSHEVRELSAHVALAAANVGVAMLSDMFHRVTVHGARWITITDPDVRTPLAFRYRKNETNPAVLNYLDVARRTIQAEAAARLTL